VTVSSGLSEPTNVATRLQHPSYHRKRSETRRKGVKLPAFSDAAFSTVVADGLVFCHAIFPCYRDAGGTALLVFDPVVVGPRADSSF
jgi:hypothetical protein